MGRKLILPEARAFIERAGISAMQAWRIVTRRALPNEQARRLIELQLALEAVGIDWRKIVAANPADWRTLLPAPPAEPPESE